MEFFQKIKSQITDFFKVIDPGTKLLAFMMIGVLFISIIIAVFLNKTPEFTLLFSNISESTAAEIVKTLDDNNVEYELKNNGKNIYVKKDKANRVRLLLKAKGLPKDGDRVGFEIFDKTNLGVTDFVQNVQHHRALAGELERTISGIKGVAGVRVHIVIPEEKLFEKEKQTPSATIMLTLNHEGALDAPQIDGIRQLAASSIEGMKPKNVTVVDNFGNILAAVEDNEEGVAGISSRMALQKSVESYYIKKVQSLLDSVLGGSNSVVRIDALLDFDKIEETEEKYDPESAVVRAETITSEKASGATSTAKGPPGVQSNMSPANKSSGGSSQENQTSREVLNNKYEINKKVSHIVKSVGDVRKLTVSVFLKQKPKIDKNGDPVKGDDGKIVFEPRTPEEIKNFNEIVNNAIGFDEKRGDKVVIKEVPFDKKVDTSFFEKESLISQDIHSAIAPGMKFIVLLGLIFLFLNLIKKRVNHEGYSASTQVKHAAESKAVSGGGKTSQMPDVYDAGELSEIKEKGLKAVEKGAFVESEISKLVENFPAETELVLKNWLKD